MTDNDVAWQPRPVLAGGLRAFALLAPLVLSVVATHYVARVVPRPDGWTAMVVWWLVLTAIGTAVLVATDRATRRVLPLASLYKLSLVFPDQAPSRFRISLRSGSPRQLEGRLREVDAHGLGDTPSEAARTLLILVAGLSEHDRLTRGHCERVRAYSELIGEELGLSAADRSKLRWAGLLHDIGKLRVPSAILNKRGRLTPEEWEIIKRHPADGAQLVAPLAAWLGEWGRAVGEHHERWDGDGYPHRLRGTDISLAGRIVAVADAFDVMTSVRSYQTPRPASQARAELVRCAGTQFDPQVVRAFLNVSLGRLRLAMGPLSALAQLALGSRVAISSALPPVATGVAALGAVIVGGGTIGLAPPDEASAAPPAAVSTPTTPAPGGTDDSTRTDRPSSRPSDARSATNSTPPTTVAVSGPSAPVARGPASGPAPPTTGPVRPPPPPPQAPAQVTTVPPTTPTAPPASPTTRTYYFENPGSGNTASNPRLALTATPPATMALPNYDTDRDAFAGRLIQKSGAGIGETDPQKYQRWSVAVPPATRIEGNVTTRIFAAVKDFTSDKDGRLTIALQICNGSTTSCRTIRSVTVTVDQAAAPGGFVMTNVALGTVSEAITSTEVLSVKVVVDNASDDDLWIAYDTAAYASAVTVTLV